MIKKIQIQQIIKNLNFQEKTLLKKVRRIFYNKGKQDTDSIIEERLIEISRKRNEVLDKNKNDLQSAISQSEKLMTEEEILNSVLEISKKEIINIDNKNNSNTLSPSIQFIIEMGFTTEEAIMAISAVGDDPELMLQYLFTLNHD